MKFLLVTTLIFGLSPLFAQFGLPILALLDKEESVISSHVVDIDNDGFQDIATFSGSNEIILHLNNGNLFKSTNRIKYVSYYQFDSPPVIDFRDLNSDNLPELVCAYRDLSGQYVVVLFKNLGNGNFSEGDRLASHGSVSGDYLKGIRFSDLNSDGFSDIIYVGTHTIKFLLGTSDPYDFLNPNPMYSNTSLYISGFDIKDFNNNGNVEIIFNCTNNDGTYSYLNVLKKTAGNYTLTNLITSGFDEGLDNFRYADVNNDQLIDVVYQNKVPQLIVGINNGNFQFNFNYSSSAFQSTAIAFELSDVNGDSYPDVVLANDKNLTYFPNNQGIFSNSIPSNIGFISPNQKLQCADFNNDGKNDFLFRYTDLRLTLSTGNSYGYTTMIRKDVVDSDLSCLDFDHNGTKDLILTNCWIPNEGSGKFGAVNFFNPSSNAAINLSSVGDLDQDGDYDIVGVIGDSLFEFINQGNNYDFAPQAIAAHNLFSAVELCDLNNDGHLDISYAIHENDNKLLFRLRQGNGWGNEQLILLSHDPLPSEFKFHFTDFNGDSKPDFVIPGYYYLSMFINNGNGFNEQTKFVSGDQMLHPGYDYACLDFNLDGYKDIIMYTYDVDYAYYLSALTNDGNMNFSGQHLTNSYSIVPVSFHFADFDSDYDLDMMISPDFYRLDYYENRYNTFDMSNGQEVSPYAGGALLFASENLFGNESKDLVISRSGSIFVFENLAIPAIQQPTTGSIYPNPASNAITFSVPFSQLQTYTIEIFSSFGTIELSGSIDNENNSLDITSLNPGVHIAKVTDNQSGEVIFIHFVKI